MRIIGTTLGGYLIEASRDEIAHLRGLSPGGYPLNGPRADDLQVGDRVVISAIYDQLNRLGARRDEINGIADRLEELAKDLRMPGPDHHVVRAPESGKEQV